MNRKILSVLTVLSLICSVGTAEASAYWVNGVTIKSIYPYGDGSFVMTLSCEVLPVLVPI